MKRTPLLRRTPLRNRSAFLNRSPMKRSAMARSTKPMRRISVKGRRKQAEWSVAKREAYEAAEGVCQLRVPGVCTYRATDPHHHQPKGRGGKNARENCKPACHACHEWCHQHQAEALAMGLVLSGLGREAA